MAYGSYILCFHWEYHENFCIDSDIAYRRHSFSNWIADINGGHVRRWRFLDDLVYTKMANIWFVHLSISDWIMCTHIVIFEFQQECK